MSSTTPLPEPRVLVDGLAYVESPRWHEDRLWFAQWGTGEIVAVDIDRTAQPGRSRTTWRSRTA